MNVWLDWLKGLVGDGGGLQEQSDLPDLQEENDTLRNENALVWKEIDDMRIRHSQEVDLLTGSMNIAEEIARRAKARLACYEAKVEFAIAHLSQVTAKEDADVNN